MEITTSETSMQFLAKVGRIMLAKHHSLSMREVRKTTAILKDFSLIPDIVDCVHDDDAYRKKLLSVAVVARLFSPVTLCSDQCRMPKGVYDYLLPLIGVKHRKSASRLLSAARVYMKNPVFRRQVEEFIELVRKEVLRHGV